MEEPRGTSFKDAIPVIGVIEVYFYLDILCPGYELETQALLHKNGLDYDRMDIIHHQKPISVYFFHDPKLTGHLTRK
jgi:hypothetical protein